MRTERFPEDVRDRVELLPSFGDLVEHYRAFHKFDVVLDNFPYSHMTIACETLYADILVVSYSGRGARQSVQEVCRRSRFEPLSIHLIMLSTPFFLRRRREMGEKGCKLRIEHWDRVLGSGG